MSRFYEPLQTDDLGRVQDLLDKAFDKVEDTALLSSSVVANVVITTTDTPVFHGLGRPIRGWVVVRSNSVAVIFEGTTPTNPSLFVNLKSGSVGSHTRTILFF